MEAARIIAERDAIIAEHGPWTAHNIHLGGDLYTIPQSDSRHTTQLLRHGAHLRRIVQIVADHASKAMTECRVLDLACLEGLYGIEFARKGASVLGIEGRRTNLEKARFAKRALGLDRLELVEDDVRNLSPEKYGRFDVVLCLGILYHLDSPDVFAFVRQVSRVCTHLAIFDTHVALSSPSAATWDGRSYLGWEYGEHSPGTPQHERMKSLWASLDNEKSFWPTRPSLWNLLGHEGFSSVYSCHNPAFPWQMADRDTVVAIKGRPVALACTPTLDEQPVDEWPAELVQEPHPTQKAALTARGAGEAGLARRIMRRVRRLGRR